MAEVQLNHPAWLGSEVGYLPKTTTVSKTTYESGATTIDGRKIVKSGTLIEDSTLGKGLLVNDVDITDGDRVAAIMIRGSYIDELLPTSIAESAEELAKQGLYAVKYGETKIAYGEVTQ